VLQARRDPMQAELVRRIASRALMLLPGAALVYLAFETGGFFPGPPAFVGVLLGLVLAARLLLGSAVGGTGRSAAAIAIAFGAYVVWVLLSGTWSHAAERALVEADLALVYALGFALFATAVTGPRDTRWVLRGLALGATVVCLGGFLSRALPKLWPIAASLDTTRISYPLTYWNALGLLAVIGIVLCVGMTSDDRESRVPKALSALPVPLLAVTVLLTFSRGAIAAGVIGLAAYMLVGRPRALLTALIALAPTTAVAVVAAYHATSLSRPVDGSALQISEGRHVALVVLVCGLAAAVLRLLLAGLDGRVLRLAERRPVSAQAARRASVAGVAVVVAASLAVGLPGAVAKQYDRFVQGNHLKGYVSVRDRLTDPGANGRIDLWRVAGHEFTGAPLAGTGAGTFELVWNVRHPPNQKSVLDAHSIYLENLGELGLVGFGLLVLVVLGSLVAIARRLRGPERSLYAATFATLLAWALGAGFDWDWEMPAVTLPVFVLAGAALGGTGGAGVARGRRRPLLAVVVLAGVLAPALTSVSQRHLDTSLAAFVSGDCATATNAAESALSPLAFRRGAHEILAYCDAARSRRGPALSEMASAVHDDPKNWETHYGLAVVTAALGGDPRPQAGAALRLNPREPIAAALVAQFRTDPRSLWADDAAAAPLSIAGQYGGGISALRQGLRTASAASPRRAGAAR
jgi:hypothetical protein